MLCQNLPHLDAREPGFQTLAIVSHQKGLQAALDRPKVSLCGVELTLSQPFEEGHRCRAFGTKHRN